MSTQNWTQQHRSQQPSGENHGTSTDRRAGKQVCAYVMKCYPALKRKKKKKRLCAL